MHTLSKLKVKRRGRLRKHKSFSKKFKSGNKHKEQWLQEINANEPEAIFFRDRKVPISTKIRT